MVRLAAVFVVIALVAALFGFGSVFNISWDGARIIFFVSSVLAVVCLVAGAYRMRAYLN